MTHTIMLIYVFWYQMCSLSNEYLALRRLWLKCYILYCLFWPIPHGNCCLNRDRQNLANTWLLYLLKNCHSYFEVDKQLFTSILENTFNLIDFGHSNDSLSYIMHLITFKCILRQHIEKNKTTRNVIDNKTTVLRFIFNIHFQCCIQS